MKDEISAAVDFLSKLVGKNQSLTREKVTEFRDTLTRVLDHKFRNHWFPDKPSKGQAYRCIRVNENTRRDSTLEMVCHEIGIKYADLMIPIELTLWIDPEEVTCRFGEHKGSYCVVASFKDGNKENFVDQINVDELEQKSMERAKQASFDLANSRKRKARLFHKYTVGNAGYSGPVDYVNNSGLTSTTASYYSPPGSTYYSSGTAKYGTPYTAPSAQPMTSPVSNMYTTNYSVSPTNRSRGATTNGSTPLQWPSANFGGYNVAGVSPSVNSPNGVQANGGSTGSGSSKFSRGLHQAFNSALTYNSYPQTQGDRYHWVSKPIVKA